MKLEKIIISNFRSFGERCKIDFSNLTAFIGNNGAGKSTVLESLSKIFDANAQNRLINRNDFHVSVRDNDTHRASSLFIEVYFTWEGDSKSDFISTIPTYFDRTYTNGIGQPLKLRIRLESTREEDGTPEGAIETRIYFITCSEDEEVREEDKHLASRQKLNRISLIYVPSSRDPSMTLRNASRGRLSQYIASINWKDSDLDAIKAAVSKVDESIEIVDGVKKLKETIRDKWKDTYHDEMHGDATLRFGSPDISSLLRSPQFGFDDSQVGDTLTDFSDGQKSLFYFSIVSSVLSIEESLRGADSEDASFNYAPPVFTILAVEEPENHIAPHLLGDVIQHLYKDSEYPFCQVMVTSHSPAILGRIQPSDVRYFRLDAHHDTSVKPILLPDRKDETFKYVSGAVQAYPELYFARLVILGEGDSEQIVLPRLLESSNLVADPNGISVVPLGGRHVNHFWRLLEDLQIPSITLLDFDQGRNGGDWKRIQYALRQMGKVNGKFTSLTVGGQTHTIKDILDMQPPDDFRPWITAMEEQDVFFSFPLDIDYSMLHAFSKDYKALEDGQHGPKANPDPSGMYPEDIIAKAVKDVLHSKGDKSRYTQSELDEMVWYSYLFLGRGKPVSHLIALSKIPDTKLQKDMPATYHRLIEKIRVKLAANRT